MASPQFILRPQPLETAPERELVEGPDVYEVRVLSRDAAREDVFVGWLAAARPLCQASNRVFVYAADGVLDREARPDDDEHEMLAEVERVLAAGHPVHAAVSRPVLPNRSEERKSARHMRLLEVGLFRVAPHDEPLGVAEVRAV